MIVVDIHMCTYTLNCRHDIMTFTMIISPAEYCT